MQRIILIVILIFPLLSNGQHKITVGELEYLLTLDYNAFENRIFADGYEYMKYDQDSKTVTFKKSDSYFMFHKDGNSIEYQTRDKYTYLNLKNTCKLYGYKFWTTITKQDRIFSKYKSSKNVLTFYPGETNKYLGYNVVINKLSDDYSERIPWLGSSLSSIEEYESVHGSSLEDTKRNEEYNHRTLFYSPHDGNLYQDIFVINHLDSCIGMGRYYFLSDEKHLNDQIENLNSNNRRIDEDTWEGEMKGTKIKIMLFRGKESYSVMMSYR